MKEQSPRTLRRELNRMEAWFRDHEHFYTPTHAVLLRAVFEEVEIHHVDVLKGYLRDWVLSDEEAAAQRGTMDEAIRVAEEKREQWQAARVEAERLGMPDPPYPTQDRAANPSLHHAPEHLPDAPSLSTQPTTI